MTSTPLPDSSRRSGATIGGGVWTMLERVISQGSQLVVFIAAARLLSPAEFGVFALVSTCAILLLRVAEVGWAPYIMSWPGDDTVPRQVLLVAILSGLLVSILGGLAGLVLPSLGFQATTAHLVILFSLWVFLATTSSAQKGVMIWRDGLRASAIAEIAGEIVGMIVGLTALYAGYGVFALVFGRLAFQSTHLAISFAVTRMAPKTGLRGAEMRDLVTYSGQIFSSRMIVNLRLYAATFIIGGFLGPASVGYYRAAQRLVGSVAEVVGAPSQVLAWSMFRQARDDHGGATTGFQAQANLFFRLLMAIGVPIFIWLTLMGEDLITGLLGAKWLPALPIVAVLSLARAILMPGAATEPILSLAGEIRRLPLFTLMFFVLTILMTLIGAPFGLLAVAWSQVIVALVITITTMWLLKRYAGIEWRAIAYDARRLVAPILLGTAVILLLRENANFAHLPALVRAFGVTLPATAVYLAAVIALDPRLRQFALGRLRRSARA